MKYITWNANHSIHLDKDVFDGSHHIVYMQRCPLALAEKLRDELGYIIWWHPQLKDDTIDSGLLTAAKGVKFEETPKIQEVINSGSISQTDMSQCFRLQTMVYQKCTFINFLPPFRPVSAHIEYIQKLFRIDFELAFGDTHLDFNHTNPGLSYNSTPYYHPGNEIQNRKTNFTKPGEPEQQLTWVMSKGKRAQYEKVHNLGDEHIGHHPVEIWFDEKGEIPVVEVS